MTTLFRSFSHVFPFFTVGSLIIILVIFIVNFTKIKNKSIVWGKSAGTLLICMWILGVSLITIMPTSWGLPIDRKISLVPFEELFSGAGVGNSNIYESVANFLMFAVGGLLIHLRFKITALHTALLGVAFGVFIESCQFIIGAGRVASLSDLILAFIGSYVGAKIAYIYLRKRAHNEASFA